MTARSCMRACRLAQALGLAAALLAATAGPARSARVHAEVRGLAYPDVSAIDLHVAALDLDVDYEDELTDRTLRLRRIGIALFEPLGDSARLGLRLGRAGVDQSGRPATAGRDPDGYFVGLEFSGAWPRQTRLRAALEAEWRYTALEERDDEGEVDLDWQTIELRPALWLAVAPRLVLRLGSSVIAVEGSERLRGGERETVDFDAAEPGGAFATLEFHRRDGDVVGLRLGGGNPAGLYLAFEHRY